MIVVNSGWSQINLPKKVDNFIIFTKKNILIYRKKTTYYLQTLKKAT